MSGISSKGNVLLVEEYDALAVAIESALRKFAPQHVIAVVASFPDARRIALEHRPELIVIDFDPPQPNAIGFLQELQTVLPDARVLIIASGVSRDVVLQRGPNAALQFIDKPFDLVDFGASVQALLGPWMDTGVSRGTLCDLAFADMAILGCIAGRSAAIEVEFPGGGRGKVHLQNGHITHAVMGELQGQSALVKILSLQADRFAETAAFDGKRTIHGPWTATLAQALREAKATPPAAAAIQPSEVVRPFPPARDKPGKRVLIVDDTEMLLIFVKDSLTLADPDLQITTASTGLDGVKQAARIVPDLVLADYSLPDITGDEVCRRIGTNEITSRVPIIMMSGHVNEMTAAAVKLPNIVATIAKPFLSDALITLVRQTLRGGPLREAAEFLADTHEASTNESEHTKLAAIPGAVASPSDHLDTNDAAGSAASAGEKIGHWASDPAVPRLEAMPSTAVSSVAPELSPNEVLLELPLEVVAMQVNSSFQIGSIRARPAAPIVAIEIPALAARAALPLETAFQLGPIDLDVRGRISTVRLLPTAYPFRAVETGNAFEICGVTVVPANERERLKLISAATSRMSMQLFAPLQLVSVELSDGLEVKELVLHCRSSAVRVSLDSETTETHSDASFETTAVQLDGSGRLTELTLAPVS